MKKKVLAVLLVLAMAISCLTACGDKDKDKKNKKKAESFETVYDLIDALSKVEKGNVSMAVDVNLGEAGHLKATISSKNDGKESGAIGLAIDFDDGENTKVVADMDDLVIIKDGMAYINLGAAADALDSIPGETVSQMLGDMKLAYFALPLPDVDFSKMKEGKTISMDSCVKFLKKAFADADVDGDDNDFTVKFKDAESYKTVLTATADFLEEQTDEIVKQVEKAAEGVGSVDVDLNAYADKLIDYYYDDAVELCSAAGIDKEEVDAMIKSLKEELKELDIKSIAEDKIDIIEAFDEEDFRKSMKSAADTLRKGVDEITDESMEGIDTEMNFMYDEGVYKIKGEMNIETKDDAGKISFTIKLDEDDYKVSAPSDLTRLKDFKGLAELLGASLGN